MSLCVRKNECPRVHAWNWQPIFTCRPVFVTDHASCSNRHEIPGLHKFQFPASLSTLVFNVLSISRFTRVLTNGSSPATASLFQCPVRMFVLCFPGWRGMTRRQEDRISDTCCVPQAVPGNPSLMQDPLFFSSNKQWKRL